MQHNTVLGRDEKLMNIFSVVCDRLNVPIANEKTVGQTTVLQYLGLTIDTVNMLVKIPDDKILELKENNILY
jgi:hypothetical protein